MYVMRPLRNFKTNQCCHLFDRIAALERRGLAGRILMPDDGEEYSL